MKNNRKLILGVGVNDWTESTWCKETKRDIPEYLLWKAMLYRVFSDKYKEKYPTYEKVTVCDEWLSMTNFINDVSKFVGYDRWMKGNWAFDKDILSWDAKVYSKDTCCFVPREINGLFTHKQSNMGNCPTGVSYHAVTGKFKAELRYCGKHHYLGVYETKEEAFQVYKQHKEWCIRDAAETWKSYIDERVYDKLINWKIT